MSTEKPAPVYETPRVTDHGDLIELTAATTVGGIADAPIPANTPIRGNTKNYISVPAGSQ